MAVTDTYERCSFMLPKQNVDALKKFYDAKTKSEAVLSYINHAATGIDPTGKARTLPKFRHWEIYTPDLGSGSRIVNREDHPEIARRYNDLRAKGYSSDAALEDVLDFVEDKTGHRVSRDLIFKIVRGIEER